MPTGIYKRTRKHKRILAKNSLFKTGNNVGPRFEKGIIPWNKGKKITFSVAHKLALSKAAKGHKPTYSPHNEEHWNWQGGKTPINRRIRVSREYKLWRQSVFERDNYTCVWCGIRGGKLNADHIKPFSLHPEFRFTIDNGRTLCVPCHKKTDTWAGRIFKKR